MDVTGRAGSRGTEGGGVASDAAVGGDVVGGVDDVTLGA